MPVVIQFPERSFTLASSGQNGIKFIVSSIILGLCIAKIVSANNLTFATPFNLKPSPMTFTPNENPWVTSFVNALVILLGALCFFYAVENGRALIRSACLRNNMPQPPADALTPTHALATLFREPPALVLENIVNATRIQSLRNRLDYARIENYGMQMGGCLAISGLSLMILYLNDALTLSNFKLTNPNQQLPASLQLVLFTSAGLAFLLALERASKILGILCTLRNSPGIVQQNGELQVPLLQNGSNDTRDTTIHLPIGSP